MKKLLGILVLGLLLNGCATETNYKNFLDSWVGQTEEHLVNKNGPPDGSYVKNDGSKILTYNTSGGYNLPGTSVIDPMTGFPKQTAGATVLTSCKTRIYISSSGIITSWDYSGNNCKR